MADQAHAIGESFRDPDLIAFARALQGRVLLKRANVEGALSLFGDAMLAATSYDLSPTVTGLIYCNVIAACTQVYAFDRAREWTSALSHWCEAQPQLMTFAGTCLVHRAELMELGGEWTESFEAARSACDRITFSNDPGLAANALYQQAEIHRLRGEDAEADAAYTECSKRGREPLPGLALLRLAQGKLEPAANAMRRVVAATSDGLQRTRYLPAHVEVMIAANALDEARAACAELEATAARYGGEVLEAMAKHAHACLALAEGNAEGAIEPLRDALHVWQRIGAPYIAARIHVLLARACAMLGDEEGALRECGFARETFEQLGATPDLAQLDALLPGKPGAGSKGNHGLSARELQVLRLVAAGKTNRAIAGELCLSEKTVDRHVSNIFGKLGVPSRAAATAYAYEHRLI
jgi:ATP/maltotriose-dependent transcriptional regulator MalT